MNYILTISLSAAGLVLGAAIGIFIGVLLQKRKFLKKSEDAKLLLGNARSKADEMVNTAKRDADRAMTELKSKSDLEIKARMVEERERFEKETSQKRSEIASMENRINQKEENITRKNDIIEKRILDIKDKERRLRSRDETIKDKYRELREAEDVQIKYLENIANLSAEEARNQLIELMEKEAQYEFASKLQKFEEEYKTKAGLKAIDILSSSIEKLAVDYVNESTISNVVLPNDEMKGRLIGREGRNIRTFEALLGVDMIIDDTPEVVTISSFQPVRREVAARVLTKLISDGRIHPKRIEEIHEKVQKEVNKEIIKTGEECVYEFGFTNIHPELIKLLGQLKFRSSYGQNALQHTKETAYIAGYIATELGLDPANAIRGGLLHDIGKAIDREQEGNHQQLGADIAKKYGESALIVNAIRAHHGDVPYESTEASIVQVADAISASRPGARRETYQFYIKRVKMLESIANSFTGVEKSFAIQAGRELRVIVNNVDINDDEAAIVARNITKKIEDEGKYPGTIKVIVIRETRVTEVAK
ncbi:ribonuclease Y [bacterium]|nr:ribonuclease Y [bacterium]